MSNLPRYALMRGDHVKVNLETNRHFHKKDRQHLAGII
jgi:hypothetical protein